MKGGERLGESEGLKSWREQVAQWERVYGVKMNAINTHRAPSDFNLAARRTFFKCEKCGSHAHSRHHMGHEYFFALMYPDQYAVRYLSFHKDDVVWLCKKCHDRIHRLYKPILEEFFDTQDHSVDNAEKFRVKLVKKCRNWLKHKIKRK